jgi:hypothetical protein
MCLCDAAFVFLAHCSDGGCYFSVNGPCSYQLGTPEYEENIIVDCYGAERLAEYRGKGRLDLCLVYGADPTMLSPAPGGRDNAVMVTKTTFQSLSLPHADGNYFLRPDRILGTFLFQASSPPIGYTEAESAIQNEVDQDAATKQRVANAQLAMAAHGEKVRQAHLAKNRKAKENMDGARGSLFSQYIADGFEPGDLGGVGDIEMAHAETPFRVPSHDLRAILNAGASEVLAAKLGNE